MGLPMEPKVSVAPAEGLFFPPPRDRNITNVLTVKNEGDKAITFKMKTTAPTSYLVRPRMGTIQGGESIAISISTQPFHGENAYPKDKFQIEFRHFAHGEERMDPKDLWHANTSLPIKKVLIPSSFSAEVPPHINLKVEAHGTQGVTHGQGVEVSAEYEKMQTKYNQQLSLLQSVRRQRDELVLDRDNQDKELQRLQQETTSLNRRMVEAIAQTKKCGELIARNAKDTAQCKNPLQPGEGILAFMVKLVITMMLFIGVLFALLQVPMPDKSSIF
eukprot:NODE_4011_length_1129_cov_75.343936_g3818_i0.p1 GENE.NODE_4011_length_1129_cov_75.343936_g3818_i0~~NODE_4011_length_1129_cov_75.343936_g3818_i0.p1  ORF type:complete len:274 (-),score=56.62 NODE_4011_length_1129_cov_75.343936_g3818_i0:212-1033(-)